MKENLNAQDSSLHPDATGKMLPTIAGHRDGCNTECPGQKVFDKMPQFRNEVKDAIDFCKSSSSIGTRENPISLHTKEGHLYIFGDAFQSQIVNYKIIHLNGAVIFKGILEHNKIAIDLLPSGLYYLILMNEHENIISKFPLIR